MIRVQGNNNVKLIECVNPMRNKWRIRWDIQISTNESGAQGEVRDQIGQGSNGHLQDKVDAVPSALHAEEARVHSFY